MPAPLFWLIDTILGLIVAVIIVNAILSWLLAFDVVNKRNQFVSMVWDFTNRLTDPMLRPIRSVVPLIGGIDLSPLILLILIQFIQYCLHYYVRVF